MSSKVEVSKHENIIFSKPLRQPFKHKSMLTALHQNYSTRSIAEKAGQNMARNISIRKIPRLRGDAASKMLHVQRFVLFLVLH